MYSNADILAAVLNKFAQPIISTLAGSQLQSFPMVQAIENKIRSTGWVSGNWSLMGEISPFIEPITGTMVQPMLKQYISQLPDESIPAMAHGIVDKAIEAGELSLFEGNVIFDKSDLDTLKKLLNANLPSTTEAAGYEVKE